MMKPWIKSVVAGPKTNGQIQEKGSDLTTNRKSEGQNVPKLVLRGCY